MNRERQRREEKEREGYQLYSLQFTLPKKQEGEGGKEEGRRRLHQTLSALAEAYPGTQHGFWGKGSLNLRGVYAVKGWAEKTPAEIEAAWKEVGVEALISPDQCVIPEGPGSHRYCEYPFRRGAWKKAIQVGDLWIQEREDEQFTIYKHAGETQYTLRYKELPVYQSAFISSCQRWAEAYWPTISPIQNEGETRLPLTLCWRNGPWLYAGKALQRQEFLTTEVGVFLEQLYRYTVPLRWRRPSNAWTFEGWADKGPSNGFLHCHGILTLPFAYDIEAVLRSKPVYGQEPQTVCRAVVDAALTPGSEAGWRGYCETEEPIWYRIHRAIKGKTP